MPVPDHHMPLRYYRKCLNLLREVDRAAASSDRGVRRPAGVELLEIRTKRPDNLIGRLAVARFLGPVGEGDSQIPSRRVCLMRNETELVVKYHRVPGTVDSGDDEWVAVFKPSSDVAIDDVFAQSEPPAHDDWIPPANKKSLVRMAFRQIKEHVDELLKPRAIGTPGPVSGQLPVAALANALAGLMPVANQDATQDPTSRTSGTRRRAVRVQTGQHTFREAPRGKARWAVEVWLQGSTSQPVSVVAEVTLAVDGDFRTDDESNVCRVIGWEVGEQLIPGSTHSLLPGETVWSIIEARDDVAVHVRFRVES